MCKRIKIVRRWRDKPCFFEDFRRSMTLQSHSTRSVNRFPVNCIMGTHSIRCQKARFEDEILGGADRTIQEYMSFIFCRLRRSETGVGNPECLLLRQDSNLQPSVDRRVTAQAPPLPLQERQGGLAGPVPPHGVGEKFQCIAALDHTGPGHGEQAGGGYLAVGALVSE